MIPSNVLDLKPVKCNLLDFEGRFCTIPNVIKNTLVEEFLIYFSFFLCVCSAL